jgi:hypothetical protein
MSEAGSEGVTHQCGTGEQCSGCVAVGTPSRSAQVHHRGGSGVAFASLELPWQQMCALQQHYSLMGLLASSWSQGC